MELAGLWMVAVVGVAEVQEIFQLREVQGVLVVGVVIARRPGPEVEAVAPEERVGPVLRVLAEARVGEEPHLWGDDKCAHGRGWARRLPLGAAVRLHLPVEAVPPLPPL